MAIMMDRRTLPRRALQVPADGGLQPFVGVGDDQLHTTESAGLQAPEEGTPERFVLAVAHVQPEDFAGAVSGDAERHDDGARHDVAADAALDVGGVAEHVGEVGVGQGAGSERLDVPVDLLADPRHRRFRHARVHAECLDEVVDLAGGGALDVGGHDHRPQGLVHPAARLQQRRVEVAGPNLGDRKLHITSRC